MSRPGAILGVVAAAFTILATIVALRSFTSPGYSGRRSDHVHSGRRTGRPVAARAWLINVSFGRLIL